MSKSSSLLKSLRRSLWFRLMLLQRGMTLGVRVIALNQAGEVLMVRHGYTPGWHLPGGGVDHQETVEAAARREVEEETGYRPVGELDLLGLSYNHRQWKGDHVAVYLARSVTKVRDVRPTFEIAEVGFFAPDNLPEGTSRGTHARLAEWQAGQSVADHWS